MKKLTIEIYSENNDASDFTDEIREIACLIEQGYTSGAGWSIDDQKQNEPIQKGEHNLCPTCHHIIDKREIALFKELMTTLARVFKWSQEKEKHEFTRKEIENLLITGNEKARFGDLVFWDGGLVYRPKGKKHGFYGLNIERCDQFFSNKMAIASRATKDPMTKEIKFHDPKFAREFPGLIKFLDADLFYQTRYYKRDDNQGKLI